MGEFSLTHWLIILVILVLFFGPSRLPQLGQSLGKALRGFKEGLSDKEQPKDANDPSARLEEPKKESDPFAARDVKETDSNSKKNS